MKKFLGVFVVALALTVATGCGKANTLKCSMTEDEEKTEITVTFENDKATKAVETMTFASESEAQMVYAFAGLAGDDVKAEIKGKTVTLTMSKSYLEDELGGKTSKADVKKSLEESGYTCK